LSRRGLTQLSIVNDPDRADGNKRLYQLAQIMKQKKKKKKKKKNREQKKKKTNCLAGLHVIRVSLSVD